MIASLSRQGGRRYGQIRNASSLAQTWSLRSLGSGGATPTPTPTSTEAASSGGSSLTYEEWLKRFPWLRDVPIRPDWYAYPEDREKLKREIVKVAKAKKSVERKLSFAKGTTDLKGLLARLNTLQEDLARLMEFYREAMAAYKAAQAKEAEEEAEFMDLLVELL